jgi:hypothetical protein
VFGLIAMTALPGAGASGVVAAADKRSQVVNFLAVCKVSHTAYDDPIVFPRKPGRSHHHTFFGNVSTNAFSTLATLRAAGTTCGRHAETAAYWVPTVFKNGREVRPLKAIAYYQVREFRVVHPYPAGLKAVAGNSAAVDPQPLRVAFWNCGAFGGVPASAAIPATCPRAPAKNPGPLGRQRVSTSLELHVNFPDCWDGRRRNSPDHHSHMAYSTNWQCPASHPVALPKLTLIVVYPVYSGRGLELSSGGRYSAHADFFNAWNQRRLARIVSDCAQGVPRCGRKH